MMKKNILLGFVICSLHVMSQTSPVASFTVNKTSGCAPLTIEFNNTSVNASSYFWDFGNGDTSTQKNPSDIFYNPGSYTVTLISFSSTGQSDTMIVQNIVEVASRPVSDFSVVNNHSCSNGTPVVFTNSSSNSTSWIWDFGDGVTSTQQNPSHIYSAAGTFSVALIAHNSNACSDVKLLSQYVIISSKPSADFTVDTTKFCSLSHSFVFNPVTVNANNYNWNFHDGQSSSLKSPSYKYSSGGKHNVTLSVTDQNGCSNILTKPNYITVSQELYPVFSANNYIGCLPLNVSFNSNLSSQLNYLWSFGDGTTSSDANPNHIYNDSGIYTVSLTVKDVNNCTFIYSDDSLVNTNDPLNAGFSASSTTGCAPLNVNFTDNSVNATSWSWDFGDGSSSDIKNPSHKYLKPGAYTVKLMVYNANNCESEIQKLNLINVAGTVSKFSANDSSGCTPLAINFSDSSASAVQWQWDFGDGTFSTAKSPVHTYQNDGYFSVKLITINNTGCSDTLVKNNFIHSFDPNVAFNIIDTISSCNEITAYFNGSSIGTNFWQWDFGDGTFSNQPNPTHTYSTQGVFSVSLSTQTANGCIITMENYNVYEIYGQNIDFSYSVDSCPNFTASFINSSPDAVSWFWDFGDGEFSTSQNPVHIYPSAGIYSVALTIFTSTGCTFSTMKSNIIYFPVCGGSTINGGGGLGGGELTIGISEGDSSNNTLQLSGCEPFRVYFANPFDSATSFLWYFGDGDSSILENPTHIYSSQGIYDVMLLVRYQNNSVDTLTRNNFIKVNKVQSDFSLQQINSCNSSMIILTNNSVNASNQSWSFGDGYTSSVINPVHTYSQSGNYMVILKSSDKYGCNSLSVKNIYAGVVVPVFHFNENVCINDSIHFSSNMNNFYSYKWDFGDGDFSTVESPLHVFDSAGTFNISLTVFDSSGCSFTKIFPEEVIVNNPIADFNISDTSGCNTLMISPNNLSTDAKTWSWDFGDGITSSLQHPTHNYTTAGSFPVSLTVEKNGCTNKKHIADAVTVYSSYANFSFIQNNLCIPVTVTLSDSSLDAVSWFWDFGDGKTDTVQNPVHIFTGTPSENITLTITNANGCTASVSKANFNEFISAFNASEVQGCDTLSVNFADMSNGAVSWEWNFGDGSTSSLQNPTHLFSDSGSFTITLIAESQDGCKDTAVYNNYINVYKVIADFTSPSILSGCNPLLINFIDNSVNATQWNWNFGDETSSSQKNPWHIYTLPSLNDISLIASNNFGCTDTVEKHNLINVTGPVAYFNLSNITGCVPLQMQFFDSSINNAINLTWYFGDGDTSNSVNPSHIFDSSGLFTVSLLAEDTSGCSSFYSFPQNIIVNPAPQASVNSFGVSGCQPLNIFFDAKLENTDSAYWNFGDGNFSDSSSASHIYDSSGVFQALLISSNNYGCSDTFYYPLLTVFPTPVADFYSENVRGCSPLSVQYINDSKNLNKVVYQWNFGNGITSKDKNPSATYDIGGVYDVSLSVTNEGGCSDTFTKNNFVFAYDNLSPIPSEALVATVTSNTSINIKWEKSNAFDFEKYVLYRRNNQQGQFIQIAVISNNEITDYSDNNLNTRSNAYCYKIQTVDFCGNAKSLENLAEYCTINVTAKPDSAKIIVSWTPYAGFNIEKYEILRAKKDKMDFEKIASVDPNTFNFEDTSWYCFVEYSYKIKAIGISQNALFSFSDTSMAKADENVFANQKVEIVRSTVIDNSAVFTEWKSPELAPEKVAGYKIYRSPGNLKFELVGILPSSIHSFTDGNLDVSKQNYYYKVETINVCNIKAQLSNNSSSVLLDAEKEGYEVKLKWTPYKNWENGVEQYIIEKQDENGNWQIIKIVDGNSSEFRDTLIK